MKTRIFIMIFGLAAIFTSCKKDRTIEEPSAPTKMDELQVPASFNWKTTKDYNLTLTAPLAGIAEVANAGGVAYQKAYLSANQAYTLKLTLPAYEKAVKLSFKGQTVDLALSANTLQYSFQ